MKKLVIILVVLVVALAVSPLQGVSRAGGYEWPCGEEVNQDPLLEIDDIVSLETNMGGFQEFFTWDGACPAVLVKSQFGPTHLKIRIANGEINAFYKLTYASGGTPTITPYDGFKLYVPDYLEEQYRDAGFNPIPFSEVTDWSWDSMLGATPQDIWAQWIVDTQLGGTSNEQLVFSIYGTSTLNPENFYICWKPYIYKMYLPLITD